MSVRQGYRMDSEAGFYGPSLAVAVVGALGLVLAVAALLPWFFVGVYDMVSLLNGLASGVAW